jgi:hypothetical protein
MTTYATAMVVSGTRPWLKCSTLSKAAILTSSYPLGKLFTKEQVRSLFWEGEGNRVLRFIRIALPCEATEVYLVGWQVTYRPFRHELRHLVA